MHRLVVLVLTCAFLPAVAWAQEYRPYVVMSGVLLPLVDSDASETVDDVAATWNVDMNAGYGATLGLGFGSDSGWSGEVEAGYRATEATGIENVKVRFSGVPPVYLPGLIPADGSLNTLSLMANGYYTFDARVFRPYAGAGIGVAQHQAKHPEQVLRTSADSVVVGRYSSDDVVFAWQLMLGLNWTFADKTEVRAGYRYFATADAKFDGVALGYGAHGIDAGLVIRF